VCVGKYELDPAPAATQFFNFMPAQLAHDPHQAFDIARLLSVLRPKLAAVKVVQEDRFSIDRYPFGIDNDIPVGRLRW
jgi:hypothetical protein